MLHIHFRKQRSPMNLYILTSSKIRNKIAKLISFNIVGIGMSLDLSFATACTKTQNKLAIAVLEKSTNFPTRK